MGYPGNLDESFSRLFERTKLPLPGHGEVYQATGGRQLVFLTDFGIVLRLTPKESFFTARSPHFLEPLFVRNEGKVQIDIDPGIECPVSSWDESESIYKDLLAKYGIFASDGKRNNLGFIPGTKFPVMIDLDPSFTRVLVPPDAVSRLTRAVNAAKGFLKPKEEAIPYDTPQRRYDPLRQLAQKSWPKDSPSAHPEKMREFLNACAEFKKAGTLAAPWENPKNDYVGTHDVAARYTTRLRTLGVVPG